MPAVTVLKPGLLVSIRSRVRGGVAYRRVELEHTRGATEVERWETTKEIPDTQAFDRAQRVRSESRALASQACSASSFGLLCPIDREAQFERNVSDALDQVARHNQSGGIPVDLYVLCGRIAENDAEAARAIGTEMRELLDTMQTGVAAGDVDAIRVAATKAKQLGQVLQPTEAARVAKAVDAARSVAREIVSRVQKRGESLAALLTDSRSAAIAEARIAFLDIDTADAPAPEPLPAGQVQRFADIELDSPAEAEGN